MLGVLVWAEVSGCCLQLIPLRLEGLERLLLAKHRLL
jgi:hypothetical protein